MCIHEEVYLLHHIIPTLLYITTYYYTISYSSIALNSLLLIVNNCVNGVSRNTFFSGVSVNQNPPETSISKNLFWYRYSHFIIVNTIQQRRRGVPW